MNSKGFKRVFSLVMAIFMLVFGVSVNAMDSTNASVWDKTTIVCIDGVKYTVRQQKNGTQYSR